MRPRIVHVGKTDLNTDGRILNELRILTNHFPELTIDFILLPDKEYTLRLERVKVHSIKCLLRNNKLLRPLIAFEFTLKTIIKLFKLSPTILHVQDSSVVLPVLFFCALRGSRRPILIYDDHEIPNDFGRKGLSGLNLRLENRLLKTADTVIFANEERMDFMKETLDLKNKLTYFLNLPYFNQDADEVRLSNDYKKKLTEIDALRSRGVIFIMHQGVINPDRGSVELADFIKKLPANYRIMILGGSYDAFQEYIHRFDLSIESFYFVGTVDYFAVLEFWNRCLASIVIYLPTKLNNRLCAPNRLYLSISKHIPVIVNRDNPVLSNFIKKYKCGVFIEDLDVNTLDVLQDINSSDEFLYDELEDTEVRNFVRIYHAHLA